MTLSSAVSCPPPPSTIMWAIDQYNSTEIKIASAQGGLLETLRYVKSIFYQDESGENLSSDLMTHKLVAMLHCLLCSQLQLRTPVEIKKKKKDYGLT